MNGGNRQQEVLLRVGFIGAGKAGTAFGRYIAERIAEKDEKRIGLAGYFSKDPDSARFAAALTGSAAFETDVPLAEASDIIFFSVPDGTIAAAFAGLTER
ncbi:MAG: Gfo/Idh/MocA family oxidoreductase, partial [Clostridiales Family XIII bacterium]|nr:Gfo/Idh/MocA family oxidoreductase [Clostridiales Family XIII bacterium]